MPFIPELLHYVNDVFVETGTFQGDTIHLIANNEIVKPSRIISLEFSKVLLSNCKKRFENNLNVTIYEANSAYELYGIIKNISSKITFWLDSHWSGAPDVESDPVIICPILQELDQIKKHSLDSHTIIIDDIRLMNNARNRLNGFPVTKDQILEKLYEINPAYTITYFNDFTAENDILVAYINIPDKSCIHKYLTHCNTNPHPPGFADFLRGTIALYMFSKMYGYKLLIDDGHPVFAFLQRNKNIFFSATNTNVTETEEFLPPLSYPSIFSKLENIFISGKSFTVMTNSFYKNYEGELVNYGNMSIDCKEYLKNILTPTVEVENKINEIFRIVYKLDVSDRFKVIHLRFGDKYLIDDNAYEDSVYNTYYEKLCKFVKHEHHNEPLILLSDSSLIANKLKTNIPELLYWNNCKIHLGDVKKTTSSAFDTIVDFFIMSKSTEIITNGGSGFSKLNSIIYDIKYSIV